MSRCVICNLESAASGLQYDSTIQLCELSFLLTNCWVDTILTCFAYSWILFICLYFSSFQFLLLQIRNLRWGRQSEHRSSSGWFQQLVPDSFMWSARTPGGSLRNLSSGSMIPVWTSMCCSQKQRWSEISHLQCSIRMACPKFWEWETSVLLAWSQQCYPSSPV